MAKKAISKMKSDKAAGPSDTVMEMIRAAGDTGATIIFDLASSIIRDGKVPTDLERSFEDHCLALHRHEGRSEQRQLSRPQADWAGNEGPRRIVDCFIRQVVSIDDSQFWHCPKNMHYDAIFVVQQLQDIYLAVNK